MGHRKKHTNQQEAACLCLVIKNLRHHFSDDDELVFPGPLPPVSVCVPALKAARGVCVHKASLSEPGGEASRLQTHGTAGRPQGCSGFISLVQVVQLTRTSTVFSQSLSIQSEATEQARGRGSGSCPQFCLCLCCC